MAWQFAILSLCPQDSSCLPRLQNMERSLGLTTTLTLQVTNGAELAEALQDVGRNLGLKVRPYTVTPRAPLASYVAAMARTGVLVARHGPLLANAAFLAPGELRTRNRQLPCRFSAPQLSASHRPVR